ncbi:hypothetical protein [Sporolactobacillus sp. KGMB 08714]|uniref:hypothetical protein n=1 Tax=Sporolactobacillus sp. KGMB 08714 TaxID=3064704 RepID=UPI002FBE4475
MKTNTKIIYNYFKVFNKIIWSEKIPFIYTVIAPTLFFVFSNLPLFEGRDIDKNQLILKIGNYLGYIVVSVMLNGISLQLLNYRENGTFKTFTMISGGDKHLVVVGLILSELLFGLICSSIFAFVIAMYNFRSFFFIVFASLSIYIISSVPIALFVLFIGVLKVRANTMITISNISLILFIWISAVRKDTGTFWGELLYGLIPNDFVTQVDMFVVHLFQGIFTLDQLIVLMTIIALYIVIGILSLSKIQVNSFYMRN